MYRSRGFAGMVDCGGGLSVQQGTACPPAAPPPTSEQQAAIAQAMVNYDARKARCAVYQKKEYATYIAAGALALLVLPGWWKILTLPVAIFVAWEYPRSEDCDYGGI